jgi:hypothetical protein
VLHSDAPSLSETLSAVVTVRRIDPDGTFLSAVYGVTAALRKSIVRQICPGRRAVRVRWLERSPFYAVFKHHHSGRAPAIPHMTFIPSD